MERILTSEFYVGQRVRVRDVDDMISEFGVKRECPELIKCPGLVFNIKGMKWFCGKTATITQVFERNLFKGRVCLDGLEVTLNDWEDGSGRTINIEEEVDGVHTWWRWTTYMLEPAEEVDLKPMFDVASFNQMLGVK